MPDPLEVQARPQVGKRYSRRLRAEGKLPAVLYGHGEGSVSLTVKGDQLRSVLRHGGQIVELKGEASGQALVQDTQWDTFGNRILHVDLLRVDAKELLHVEVPIETRGDAPGENEGGLLEHVRHTVEIETTPANIPEKLFLDTSGLHINESLTAADLDALPEGVKLLTEPERVIINCTQPVPEADEEDAGITAAAGEPEVIGAKAEEEEGEGEGS
jgi:large subunit ribosomal protein L25